MTSHSNDSADENDGKYSSDQQMTFETLLKSSLRERSNHEQMSSQSVENQNHSFEAKSDENATKTSSKQQDEEPASNQRKAIAKSIGNAHASDQYSKLAEGQTKAIGHHTTYKLARTSIDNETFYYVAQVTDQSYDRHHAQLIIKDFGTSWSFDVAEPNKEILQNVIAEQRRQDIRVGKDPVEWLTENQLDRVSEWYQSRTSLEFASLEERYRKDSEDIQVIDQYLIADQDQNTLLSGHDLQNLTERQITVVLENLLNVISPNLDLPVSLETDIQQRTKYPLFGEIGFD
jgi:hypothetical protein